MGRGAKSCCFSSFPAAASAAGATGAAGAAGAAGVGGGADGGGNTAELLLCSYPRLQRADGVIQATRAVHNRRLCKSEY